MNSQVLLETYGKAASVVKDFYLGKFIDSMDTTNVPENYKEFAMEQGIDNDTVAQMMNALPRALFDAFDAHEVYIEITVLIAEEPRFMYHVNGEVNTEPFYTCRTDAEKAAIEKAFEILNEKL